MLPPDIVIILVYIHETNPYTPLVTISHIQICYQLLQTHPSTQLPIPLKQVFNLSVCPGDDC